MTTIVQRTLIVTVLSIVLLTSSINVGFSGATLSVDFAPPLAMDAVDSAEAAEPNRIGSRWICGWGSLGELKCFDPQTVTTFICFKDGSDWTCFPGGMKPGSQEDSDQLERDIRSNPEQVPSPAIAISPSEQVTDEYCYGYYAISVPMSANPTTLQIVYGDGFTEYRGISAGAGDETFLVSHQYPYDNIAVDEFFAQSVSILELGIYNSSLTHHVADGANRPEPTEGMGDLS